MGSPSLARDCHSEELSSSSFLYHINDRSVAVKRSLDSRVTTMDTTTTTDTAETASVVSLEEQPQHIDTLMEDDTSPSIDDVVAPCDACPHCDDVCTTPDCHSCCHKSRRRPRNHNQHSVPINHTATNTPYTLCQIRRHNHSHSCWLVAGDGVYDATAFVAGHPGGADCLLAAAGGGRDCTRDIQFHSKAGQRLVQKCRIGTVVPCSGCSSNKGERETMRGATASSPWWSTFWN